LDWLSKIEEERRLKANAEGEAAEQRRRAAEKVRSSLAALEERLRPTLDPLIADIARRLGLQLKVRLSAADLTISAPNSPNSDLVNGHRIVIRQAGDQTRLHVAAIRADQIHRSSEYKPADMTLAEWRGEDETIVRGETTVEYLVRGDLQLLTEWLVRAALDERGRAPAPKIRIIAVRQRKTASMSFGKFLLLGLIGLAAVFLLWYYLTIG
jgi:hypothetical protein